MTFSSVFIVNFENISHIVLVFPLLTQNKLMPAKYSVAFFAQCWKALKKKELCISNRFTFRTSHWKCSAKKDINKNFPKFTGNYLC